LWDKPPCDNSQHERFFGLVRPDGSLKPHARVLRDFSAAKPQVKPIPDYAKLTIDPGKFYGNPVRQVWHMTRLYRQYLKNLEKSRSA
jgi:hypothetical protein